MRCMGEETGGAATAMLAVVAVVLAGGAAAPAPTALSVMLAPLMGMSVLALPTCAKGEDEPEWGVSWRGMVAALRPPPLPPL